MDLNAALGYTNCRKLTVNLRKFSMKEKEFMENSCSIHGNLRSSTQWIKASKDVR